MRLALGVTTTTANSGHWQAIEGLGIEKLAMTILPYEMAPISNDKIETAPSIDYTFAADVESCTIEARFLPTHRVNDGMGLRYAISVDGDAAQIRDINAPEWSAVWSHNVLRGYSTGTTRHDLRKRPEHTITIRLLSPGMVLSQVRVHK